MKRILVLLVTILTVLGCSKEESQPKMYKLTVSSNPTEGGTINPTSGEYEEGTEVTIRVNTNTHYIFDKWSGSWSGSKTPLTITMDSDKNLVGNFKLLDTDGDGVTDNIDQCNDTPSGLTVDEKGCSDSQKDTDGDGITDDLDTCPDTPSGEEVNEIGCSSSQIDTDGDGVMDDVDQCVDEYGLVELNGCNDTDGDGVTDNKDTCSDTRNGVPVDENGCMLNPIYLDENGITIKSYDWGEVGDTGEVNGITYTIVSEERLREIINNKENFSQVCTSKIQNTSWMFFELNTQNREYNISSWDVSNVTDMNHMFGSGGIINGDVSSWDVSNVTNMRNMLQGVDNINDSDISSWDVSSVTDMSGMFNYCTSFNQDISNWNVGNVTTMRWMLRNCRTFNQDLSSWDVSNVTEYYQFDFECTSWTLPKPNFQ